MAPTTRSTHPVSGLGRLGWLGAALVLAGCSTGSGSGAAGAAGAAGAVQAADAAEAVVPAAAAGVEVGTAAAQVTGLGVQACDVLTPERAREVLGSLADVPTAATTGTADADLALTSCSYVAGDRDESGARDALGLVVRTALSDDGARANRDRFSTAGRPADAQQVDGLGDRAFWAPAAGQLNVLRDDRWYILSYGGPDPRTHRLEDTRDAARVLTDVLTPP